MRAILLQALNAAGAIFAIFAACSACDSAAAQRIVAYLPDYRMDTIHSADLQGLTDLIYFSVTPGADGTLITDNASPLVLARVLAFKKHLKLRTEIAVGGWQRSQGFAPMAHSADARAKFIGALVKLCVANGIDGVDYDWEGPSNSGEDADYTELIVGTSRALHKIRARVSVAIGVDQRLDPRAVKAADEIPHLMAYDHDGRHSTYDAMVSDITAALNSGIPASKLVVGVPFYGRRIADRTTEITYSDIVRQFHPGPSVDEVAGYYFNGPRTMVKKSRYARDKGLAGVMIWEIGQDVPGSASLLQAVELGLSGKVINQPATSTAAQ